MNFLTLFMNFQSLGFYALDDSIFHKLGYIYIEYTAKYASNPDLAERMAIKKLKTLARSYLPTESEPTNKYRKLLTTPLNEFIDSCNKALEQATIAAAPQDIEITPYAGLHPAINKSDIGLNGKVFNDDQIRKVANELSKKPDGGKITREGYEIYKIGGRNYLVYKFLGEGANGAGISHARSGKWRLVCH